MAPGTIGGTLASARSARTTAGGDTIGVNVRGASSEPVSLNFTYNTGGSDHVGLTGIAFDQVLGTAPEPASLAAATCVALGLAVARRLRSAGRQCP